MSWHISVGLSVLLLFASRRSRTVCDVLSMIHSLLTAIAISTCDDFGIFLRLFSVCYLLLPMTRHPMPIFINMRSVNFVRLGQINWTDELFGQFFIHHLRHHWRTTITHCIVIPLSMASSILRTRSFRLMMWIAISIDIMMNIHWMLNPNPNNRRQCNRKGKKNYIFLPILRSQILLPCISSVALNLVVSV